MNIFIIVKTNIGDYMINNYEIRKQNNEEILYLYLDFNNEFAKMNFKEHKEKLENIINDFIKNNKIVFTGTTVALVVGSTIVGNVILNNDQKELTYNENNFAIEEKVDLKPTEEESIEDEKDISEVKIETKELEKTIKTNNNPSSTTVVQNTTHKSDNKVNNTSTSTTTNTTQKQEEKVETKQQEKNTEQPVDNNIYVKVKTSNGDILTIELEEYIVGVVGVEMPAAFHDQALMSQAIIARTYALKANSKGQVLTDNESTQSYKDNNQLKSMWGSSYNTYYNKVKNAVYSTKGMYLTYNGTYIEAVYHSTSNGRTEDSSNVWGNYFPYLVSVDSEYDSLSPTFIQEKTISYQELSTKLGIDVNIDTQFNILSRTSGDRIDIIEVNGKTYRGVDLRNSLGLRSADFDITKTDSGVIFTTRGYGHGVGLSQYGANGMAKNGYSYIQILQHYYQGVSINHL